MDTTSTRRELPEDAAAARKPRRGAIQVYETLRDDILWLRIAPGSAIDELALAARFEISRTPIREALMLLAAEWLVVFLPNRTSIVPPLSLHNMGEYMDMYLLLSRAVIRGVIQNLPAVDRHEMQARLTELLDLLERAPGEPALRADLSLRHWLGDLAGNTFQNRYYRQILDAGIRSKILHFFPNSTPSDLAAMLRNWQALIDAILHHEFEAADRIVTQMILAENEIILRSLQPRFGHELPLTSHPFPQEPPHA